MKQSGNLRMTNIVILHYVKLIFRSALFLAALVVYIYNFIHKTGALFSGFENNKGLLTCIWLVFFFEMLFRFFPSSLESMGCQKQFARNFIKKETKEEFTGLHSGKTTFLVLVFWLLLNGIIGSLYICGMVDKGIMLLVALFYSVCDVVCILFFCPFQTWIMKNKCCTTCRIYNWDYAMMFTPLFFVKNVYAWSLLLMALLLVLKWECAVRRFPERFCEQTNLSLSCIQCREKLCHHKKQLQIFLKKEKFNIKGNVLFKKDIEKHSVK